MRILVVDDDRVSQQVLLTILTKNGYEVSLAKTGREAIFLLEQDASIELIISDIMMPVMDGFDLLQYVKSDSKLQNIPVLISSAKNNSKTVLTSIDLGASDFITKPVKQDVLLHKITKAEAKIPGAILVVDDEELLLHLLDKILTRAGYKTQLAENPYKAMDILKQKKIAVVLSDIKMPEMDGIELLAEIKKTYKQMPVLLMTGHGSEYSKTQVIASGADDYITKPFKNTEIMVKIKQFMKLKDY